MFWSFLSLLQLLFCFFSYNFPPFLSILTFFGSIITVTIFFYSPSLLCLLVFSLFSSSKFSSLNLFSFLCFIYFISLSLFSLFILLITVSISYFPFPLCVLVFSLFSLHKFSSPLSVILFLFLSFLSFRFISHFVLLIILLHGSSLAALPPFLLIRVPSISVSLPSDSPPLSSSRLNLFDLSSATLPRFSSDLSFNFKHFRMADSVTRYTIVLPNCDDQYS